MKARFSGAELMVTLLSEPMTAGWKIAFVMLAIVVAAALLAALVFAVHAWRSSHLFERQYRFPKVPDAPLRLGAAKSGGRMSTLVFGQPGVRNQRLEGTPPR